MFADVSAPSATTQSIIYAIAVVLLALGAFTAFGEKNKALASACAGLTAFVFVAAWAAIAVASH